MEEVIDCINATRSPEELAIQFLMRHARCRMALTVASEENPAQQALLGPRTDTPANPPKAADRVEPVEIAASVALVAPEPAAARDDSCAARFSRAYVAARHMSVSRHPVAAAGKAAA